MVGSLELKTHQQIAFNKIILQDAKFHANEVRRIGMIIALSVPFSSELTK